MKILYHHRTQYQGVEKVHIKEIARAFINLNHTVKFISPMGIQDFEQLRDEGPAAPKKTYSFISKYVPEICFEFLEILYNFIAAKRFSSIFKNEYYDLIYERYAIFNWAGVANARRYKTRIILEVNYTSYTPLHRKRSIFLRLFAHWLDKKIFAAADRIVVVSSYLKNHLVSLGIDKTKIVILPNAADPEMFNWKISGDSVRKKFNLENKKVIGFVGGFYPWHGLDLLVDAFHDLINEVSGAVLLLIGDGPVKEDIKLKIKNKKIEDYVYFINKVFNENLPEYIAAFDIAVIPDSNEYGSPMKIYEYMSMGKPVVAPRLGPIEDGIHNGRDGLLFLQRNKKELKESLMILLSDNKLKADMGSAARDNIINNHTWQKNAATVISLCEDINNRGKKFE